MPTCECCGGSGIEMYVGWGNSVTERPCSLCQPQNPADHRPSVARSAAGNLAGDEPNSFPQPSNPNQPTEEKA